MTATTPHLSVTIGPDLTVTVTPIPDTADLFGHSRVTLAHKWGGGHVGSITLRAVEVSAHFITRLTKPDPWQALLVAEALKPDEYTPQGRCESLADLSSTLPEQMAYPLRDTAWHSKPPLHAQELKAPWFSMLAALADAADEIKRATGHDMSAVVQHAADTFTRAAAVSPDIEAALAKAGYTTCELAFTELLQTCKNLGEAITKHRLGNGLKLSQASEAARQIVDSAVRIRTEGAHHAAH